MEVLKVCRGCFKELELEDSVCPICGWEPDKEYEEVRGWTVGKVLKNRYLLGLPYIQISNATVWRVYDRLLGFSCFVLQTDTGENLSQCQRDAPEPQQRCREEDSLKILASKMIDHQRATFFSMKNMNESPEEILRILQSQMGHVKNEPINPEDIGVSRRKAYVLANGTILGEHYQILDCIGIGGFGIIYLCQDLMLQRLVALKEYFPAEWAERDESYVIVKKSQMLDAYRYGIHSLYKEAKFLAKFIHTHHIVTVYDVLEENETAYLVMEHLPGINIGREMRARNYQPYTLDELAQILFPVMDALEAMHEAKIIHSDISPENIMRLEQGEITLIDMGAAKYALDSRPVPSAAFLKINYAAPEQYQTAAQNGIPKNEGTWTDVYSLGATTYFLLMGQKPPDVLKRLKNKNSTLAIPPKCKCKHAKKWIKLFNRAMALDTKERIGSIAEFKEELRKLLG